MNLSSDQDSVGAEEVAPPSQPHRLSTSCDVHPEERFSGFCPSCLCERLSVLDHNGAPPQPASSSSRKPSTITTAALKALFKPSSGNSNANGNGRVRAGFFPELRRSKSFSGKNKEGISGGGGLEPQRRSCDVRLREENRNREGGKILEDEGRKSSVSEAVVEVAEEEEENGCEIVEEKEEEKAMKEYMYMDLYPQTKKPSSVPFFSVLSKKLQKWRNKQKTKKPRNVQLPVERAHTQSEIAGRRSSDTDPRFSLDAAGRFSVDIGRISVDEPRASWDGHLPPLARVPPPPSMLSVVENAPSDMQVPTVEETSMINGGESDDPIIIIPGGSSQTRDYYTEPPRRKSLDRSNSIKKAMEKEEVKSNARVSPAIAAESYTSSSMVVNQNGGDKKSSRRWGKWSMFGFIYRKGVVSKDDDDRYSRSNSTGVVERSFSQSWPDLRNEAGGGPKMRRSNSNASWRSSGSRNKSWRNSSKDGGGDNGMLRFYLTPTWRNGGSGGGSGWEKTAARANSHGHSIARRVMRLY